MNPNRQMNRHPRTRIAATALLLAATALPGHAEDAAATALPSVEVSAPGARAGAVCPAFAADMLKSLSQIAMQTRQPGLLDVNFAVDGRQVDEIAIAGAPFEYRSATRRAVRSLDCDNGSAGRQAVHLQVVFKDL